MKINGGSDARGVRATSPKRTRASAEAGGFASHLETPTTAAPTEVAGPSSVAALLAVQAAGDALDARKQTYDRAEGLLKRLDGLHTALLEGRVDDEALKRLAADLERQSADCGDPALAEMLAEIELRAAVELAKRGLI